MEITELNAKQINEPYGFFKDTKKYTERKTMKVKDGFIFHLENVEDIKDLTLEEKGMIFEAMVLFAQTGTEMEFDDRYLQAVWRPIRRRMVRDNKSYMAKCQANRENGARGGRPKNAETPETQENPTVFDENPKNRSVFSETHPDPDPGTNTDIDTNTNPVSDTERERDTRAQGADSIPFSEIIEYLNTKTGAKYSSTSKENRRCIKDRWGEGYKLEDFKRVIDNKCNDWLKNDKMAALLRPCTLFGTKFENYLNQPRAKPKNAFLDYNQRDDDLDKLERILDQQFVESMEAVYGAN